MQDANKRKMLADRVLNECKTAMELNIDHVPKFFAESVAAVQALTVTKGLKLLANFIDRDKIARGEQEDTDAVMQIAQQVCQVLQESAFRGPARTCPLNFRDEHLNICLQLFKINVAIHDDLSVRHWNKNSFREAEQCNSSSKQLMDEASDYKCKVFNVTQQCSNCKNRTCGDGTDGGQWQDIMKQYGELYADLHKRIHSHEEIIRKRLDKDPEYQRKKEMQKKLQSRRNNKTKASGSNAEGAGAIMLPPSEEQVAKEKAAADEAMRELLEEEEKAAAAEKKKRDAKAGKERKKKAAEEAERKKKEEEEEKRKEEEKKERAAQQKRAAAQRESAAASGHAAAREKEQETGAAGEQQDSADPSFDDDEQMRLAKQVRSSVRSRQCSYRFLLGLRVVLCAIYILLDIHLSDIRIPLRQDSLTCTRTDIGLTSPSRIRVLVYRNRWSWSKEKRSRKRKKRERCWS